MDLKGYGNQCDFKILFRKAKDPRAYLFRDPAVVLSLFRSLEPIQKQLILRFMHVKEIPFKTYQFFSKVTATDGKEPSEKEQEKELFDSLKPLLDYQTIMLTNPTKLSESRIVIDNVFQETFSRVLINGLQLPFTSTTTYNTSPEFLKKLRAEGIKNWRKIHYSLLWRSINYENTENTLSKDLNGFLFKSGLITEGKELTSEGFQFILNSYDFQLNFILLHYIGFNREVRRIPDEQTIITICSLSLCDPLQEYVDKKGDPTFDRILTDFAEIGLVWRPNPRERTFYVSPFLSHFIYEKSSGKIEINLQILVETNFKFYAYTIGSSEDEFAAVLLGEFAQIQYKVNKMFYVCELRRETCEAAFRKKIRAEQIVSFLNSYAHPVMRESRKDNSRIRYALHDDSELLVKTVMSQTLNLLPEENNLPENVVQQIYLWEKEFKKQRS